MPFVRIALLLSLVAPAFLLGAAKECNWGYIASASRRIGQPPSATLQLTPPKGVDVKEVLKDRLINGDQLKLMTLNTENLELFYSTQRPHREANGRVVAPLHQKPIGKVLAEAEHILQQRPDVVTLQEVADAPAGRGDRPR